MREFLEQIRVKDSIQFGLNFILSFNVSSWNKSRKERIGKRDNGEFGSQREDKAPEVMGTFAAESVHKFSVVIPVLVI